MESSLICCSVQFIITLVFLLLILRLEQGKLFYRDGVLSSASSSKIDAYANRKILDLVCLGE